MAISFKHFPLSTSCNPLLNDDMQPRACDAAFAAIAASQQGAFWTYHDHLFSSDLSADEELLENTAKISGLDLARWQEDRHSVQTQNRVKSDIALAYQLEVSGTPTVFLNGRLVENAQLPILEFLIQKEMEILESH